MGRLIKKLQDNYKSDIYPMHMPGHKRNIDFLINPFSIDITEIDGFDDLHNPRGLLKSVNGRLALMYGCDKAIAMVNGSTGGILSAVSAVVDEGDELLMARNCHKSVYNAVFLRKARPSYIYPQQDGEVGINGAITAESVDIILKNNSKIKAVVITSPTYEGVISDVAGIAKVVHGYGIPLIVDAAHGAHLFDNYLFDSADIYVISLHKTLPALTQTAVLCYNEGLVDYEKVCRFFDIYVTSSPSYLLMASIEKCLDIIDEKGRTLFDRYYERIGQCRRQLDKLNKLYLYKPEGEYDNGKLVICTNHSNINGAVLKDRLLNNYHIQIEMVSNEYIIAMTSILDTEEGIKRFTDALSQIDNEVREGNRVVANSVYPEEYNKILPEKMENYIFIELNKSENFVCNDYIYVYPPGIPIVVPGEVMTPKVIQYILQCIEDKLEVFGVKNNKIKVIKKD